MRLDKKEFRSLLLEEALLAPITMLPVSFPVDRLPFGEGLERDQELLLRRLDEKKLLPVLIAYERKVLAIQTTRMVAKGFYALPCVGDTEKRLARAIEELLDEHRGDFSEEFASYLDFLEKSLRLLYYKSFESLLKLYYGRKRSDYAEFLFYLREYLTLVREGSAPELTRKCAIYPVISKYLEPFRREILSKLPLSDGGKRGKLASHGDVGEESLFHDENYVIDGKIFAYRPINKKCGLFFALLEAGEDGSSWTMNTYSALASEVDVTKYDRSDTVAMKVLDEIVLEDDLLDTARKERIVEIERFVKGHFERFIDSVEIGEVNSLADFKRLLAEFVRFTERHAGSFYIKGRIERAVLKRLIVNELMELIAHVVGEGKSTTPRLKAGAWR